MNKTVKHALIGTGIGFGVVFVALGAFVGYVLLSYYRIGDKKLKVHENSSLMKVDTDTTYKALSYNIGFGAYSQDFTFFLDEGYDENGKKTCGYWSTGRTLEEVEYNTTGSVNVTGEENPDFLFLQEVDTASTRSYWINQDKRFREAYPTYDHVFANNFHTAFLPYPLYDMHGKVNSGLTTLSRYHVTSAERKSYSVSKSFSKYFDLDRCFSSSTVEVENGKTLYIINSHMSAYDKTGLIREKQVEELKSYILEKYNEGNYVIVGGDWNHDLLTYNPDFGYTKNNRPYNETKKDPNWLSPMFDEDGKDLYGVPFKVVASDNFPTCRNNDIKYEPGKTYICTVDGFLISDNIEVVDHKTIPTTGGKLGYEGFAFSDHNPTMMEFKLK